MSRPSFVSSEVARIHRAAGQNTAAADLVVAVCTVEPRGAPSHARPRFVTLALHHDHLRETRENTIAIRRVELEPVVSALTSALRALTPATFEHGAGI